MEEEKPKLKISLEGFDPLGLKSAGEISKQVVQLGIDGVKAFLNLTCKPLLEELGLGLKDQYRNWRLTNIIKMIEKAKGKINFDLEKENLVIDPRVAFQIVEHASIVSNDTLQDMWAGLFAASCLTYEEDENIFFIDILKRLTSSQVKLLNYLCEKSSKNINIHNLPLSKEEGLVTTNFMKIPYQEIREIMETSSTLKADSELAALQNMALIELQGRSKQELPVQKIKSSLYEGIKPSLIAILLYVKCQGSTETPFDFFLPQIKDNYYYLLKDYFQVTEDNILDIVYLKILKGKEFEHDIEFGSNGFKIKGVNWTLLSENELSSRLRDYSIFRYMMGIDKSFSVEVDNIKIGEFDYKTGFKRL